MSFDLSDYVDVAERIQAFAEKYPEGSLQSEVDFIDGGVLCKAYAFRTDEDKAPGVGHAFEPIPGKTPYTKDSEVMNAETSAWGRAIVALGFASKKIASLQEVQNRSGAAPPTTTDSVEGRAQAGSTAAPDNPAAQAQAAMRASKEARAPQDNGAPENVILTFGKHKGAHLGAVPRAYLEWLTSKFDAKTAEQRRVLTAAQLILNGPGVAPFPDDDIPF